jgi:hypothetical protein
MLFKQQNTNFNRTKKQSYVYQIAKLNEKK